MCLCLTIEFTYRGESSQEYVLDLTLPGLKARGFFLQPATLLVLALPERVAGVCPEAFRLF